MGMHTRMNDDLTHKIKECFIEFVRQAGFSIDDWTMTVRLTTARKPKADLPFGSLIIAHQLDTPKCRNVYRNLITDKAVKGDIPVDKLEEEGDVNQLWFYCSPKTE